MWITLVVFLFVVPALVTLFIVYQNLTPDLNKGSVTAVTLIHEEETDEIRDRESVRFFVSLATGGSVIEKTADPLYEYRKLEVVYHKLGNQVVYHFYLSDSIHNCVYTDSEGTLYLLEEEDAKKLLAHPLVGGFAVSYAARPTLAFFQGGQTFFAKSVEGEWSYQKANEKPETEMLAEKSENRVVLPQGEKLNFRFSLNPDFCKVLLQDKKGEVLFTGKPEEMPLIERKTDDMLILTVSADWYEDAHAEYHGSITYTYDIFYDIPASLSLDRTEVAPGENITLTVFNSSSDSLAVTPSFSAGNIQKIPTDHGYTVLIPVSEDATPREYSILVMGSDVEETLAITVVPKAS